MPAPHPGGSTEGEGGSRHCELYRTLYNYSMSEHKPLNFRGSALADLRAFPATVRQEVGYQLDKVQRGLEPKDWKPMATVGQGVREIRIRDANGAFRVVYVAKLAEAVYVLHCFQKKTQKTSKADLDLAEARYRALLSEVKQ